MSNVQMHGNVAVITMNNPPMNTMGHGNRSAVMSALTAANADAKVKAIVLTGGGKVFSSGAEIKEFNTPAAFAAVRPLITALRLPWPIVFIGGLFIVITATSPRISYLLILIQPYQYS